MKVLSLWQPWASLIAIGAKTIETRSWGTSYRGPLAIHAAASFNRECRDFHGEMLKRYWALTAEPLPFGAIVATCNLVACHRLSRAMADAADEGLLVLDIPGGQRIVSPQEQELGNYAPTRFAWLLADVKPVRPAILAKGARGLWDWNDPRFEGKP